jgi:hypothetical protein
MKIAEFQNLFRETQKKLPINDDTLTKNYQSVEKLEDFLKNFDKQRFKEEQKAMELPSIILIQNLSTGLVIGSYDESQISA